MPDEEIDKLIFDAASQHHPPYDDSSWGKMEVLLDKHLPQKKDNKKLIGFLLVILFLGGTVFFGMENNRKNVTTIAKNTDEKKPVNTTSSTSEKTTNNNTETAAVNNTTTEILSPQKINLPVLSSSKDVKTETYRQQISDNKRRLLNQKSRFSVKIKKATGSFTEDNAIIQKNEPLKNISEDNPIISTDIENPDDLDKKQITEAIELNKNEFSAKNDTIITTKPESENNVVVKKQNVSSPKNNNINNKFIDKLALTLSGGAGMSYINLNNSGKIKPIYGIGLNYAVGKHFLISSGLFISKKVYSALPDQYKFPGGNSYPYLTKINADCKVYEIPLTVYYKFKETKNQGWFGGLGISSLLMKKEFYDFRYATPTGQIYNYTKTVSNENKHYFSVLTLSGGYQYKFNTWLSLLTEPYLKIPLSGIGSGKVKLNSAGLLFTAVIKPFISKKNSGTHIK